MSRAQTVALALAVLVLGGLILSLPGQPGKAMLLVTPSKRPTVGADRRLSPRLKTLGALSETDARVVGQTPAGQMVIQVPRPHLKAARAALTREGANVKETTKDSPRPARTLLVRYTNPKTARRELEALGYRILEDYAPGSFFRVVPKEEGGLRAASVRGLRELTGADHVELERPVRLPSSRRPETKLPKEDTGGTPNDAYWEKLWGLRAINAPKAWKKLTEAEVVVAVLDTGVDYRHEDLKDNMWTNPKPDPKKKDVHGYDFLLDTGDPKDQNGHGTHCAGTIGARGNNKKGVVGVNWKVKIMAVRFLDRTGVGSNTHAVMGIDYALRHGAQVINASFAELGYDQLVYDAVKRAADKGVLFVAAAGNDENDNDDLSLREYPASYLLPNVLSVMAVDRNDRRAAFAVGGSGFGKDSVHVAAPGVDILSCQPGNNYGLEEGSSMAAAHVAGAAALVWSHPKYADLGYRGIRKLLLDNARVVKGLKCQSGVLDIGFLND